MIALSPLPLLSFDPEWEARWDAEHQRHLELKDIIASVRFGYFDRGRQERLNEELRVTGAALGQIFVSQFRTTDEYRDWRLRNFDSELCGRGEVSLRMPAGLPIREIRRRMTEASDYRRQRAWRRRHAPAFGDRVAKLAGSVLGDGGAVFLMWERAHVRRLFSRPPAADVLEAAHALRQAGGDYV